MNAAGYLAQLQALLPPGDLWRRDEDASLTLLLKAAEEEFARIDGRAQDLLREADPRTTSELLQDFERVLGPDPCVLDQAGLPVADRRRIVHSRWTARGGASIRYFTAIAAALGYAITITEFRPFVAGRSRAGDSRWQVGTPTCDFTGGSMCPAHGSAGSVPARAVPAPTRTSGSAAPRTSNAACGGSSPRTPSFSSLIREHDMRRLGPFNPVTGETDNALSWQDGNPATGQEGSIPSHRHWTHPIEEIVHVIEQAGLQPTAADLTQLWQAIQIAIEQFVGGDAGGAAAYVTQAAALQNLPIFPEVLTPDGRMTLTPGAGVVVLAADQSFVHRGVFRHSTTDWELAARTFATQPSKTYHLRWRPLTGFALEDLANAGYNPAALDEWDAAFDTGYDDVILHRVETNSSNVATITALANKARLGSVQVASPVPYLVPNGGVADAGLQVVHDFVLNWARTPDASGHGSVGQDGSTEPKIVNYANQVGIGVRNRYRVQVSVGQAWDRSIAGHGAYAALHMMAMA